MSSESYPCFVDPFSPVLRCGKVNAEAIPALPEGHVYNELQILGREDLTTGAWDAMKDGDQFFKAELKVPTK